MRPYIFLDGHATMSYNANQGTCDHIPKENIIRQSMKKEGLRMAKKKEYRSLKISSIWNYGSNPSPMLRLQGKWMEELGFQIGETVLVKCEGGELIITPDTMRAETESREKEFLDREMALLQKRFDAEKQKIRQQIVAEREAMYVAEGR